MPKCRTCQGTGWEVYDEDGRRYKDACYHCSNTGFVDDDLDYHDRLRDVASALAYNKISDYRRARNNSDYFEEDFAFCAAENGMSERDYFISLVWEEEAEIMAELLKFPLKDQQLLITWNEYEDLPAFEKNNVIPLRPVQDDSIPF